MEKFKIQWIKKGKYAIIKYTEDGDAVYLEKMFEGSIHEVEEELKKLRNV